MGRPAIHHNIKEECVLIVFPQLGNTILRG
jgi:hypothetical protein